MFVKPAPGTLVRDPATKSFVPEEGMTVDPNNLDWARMVADGSVVVADAPVKGAKAKGKAKATPTPPPADPAQTEAPKE